MKRNKENTITAQELRDKLIEKGEKISKAEKVRALIQKEKGFWKKKESLTDFVEPVLFLERQNGHIEFYEKATSGKFTFDHSDGKPRFIELRPSDQKTFQYGDKRVRCYYGHENRPFANWDNPIVDSDDVKKSMEKIRFDNSKYEERLQKAKNSSRFFWIWLIVAMAGFLFVGGFVYYTWIQPALAQKAITESQIVTPPSAGLLLVWFRKKVARFK